MPVPAYSFPEKFSSFSFLSLLTKAEVIAALVKVRAECNKVSNLSSLAPALYAPALTCMLDVLTPETAWGHAAAASCRSSLCTCQDLVCSNQLAWHTQAQVTVMQWVAGCQDESIQCLVHKEPCD